MNCFILKEADYLQFKSSDACHLGIVEALGRGCSHTDDVFQREPTPEICEYTIGCEIFQCSQPVWYSLQSGCVG